VSTKQLPEWCATVDLSSVWSGRCGVAIMLDEIAGAEQRHRCCLQAGHDKAHSCGCGCEWKQ
jgi:hypothetical protein